MLVYLYGELKLYYAPLVLKLQSNKVDRAAVGGGQLLDQVSARVSRWSPPVTDCDLSRACTRIPSNLLHRRSGIITCSLITILGGCGSAMLSGIHIPAAEADMGGAVCGFLWADKYLQGPAPLFRRNFAPCYLLHFISSAASPNPPLGLSLICAAAKQTLFLFSG